MAGNPVKGTECEQFDICMIDPSCTMFYNCRRIELQKEKDEQDGG